MFNATMHTVIIGRSHPLSSLCSGTSFFQNENPGKSLREIRKRLASLEKEKELVLLTRKSHKIEAEKAAGFPLSHPSNLA